MNKYNSMCFIPISFFALGVLLLALCGFEKIILYLFFQESIMDFGKLNNYLPSEIKFILGFNFYAGIILIALSIITTVVWIINRPK